MISEEMNRFEWLDEDLKSQIVGKNILITGGSGLIGSTICRMLSYCGGNVTILDNLSAYPFEYVKRYGTLSLKNCSLIQGDVSDDKLVSQLVTNQDVIIHAAALADVAMCMANPDRELNENVFATHHLLMSARNAFVGKIVFVSSASVYGNPKTTNIFSEDMPTSPISNYGNSKLWGEHHAEFFYRNYGLSTVSVRYFSVYGAPQIPKRGSHSWAVAVFGAKALQKRTLTIYGDGKQIRDFVHVLDIAEGTIRAALSERAIGMAINIGTGRPTSILDVAQLIMDLVPGLNIKYQPRPLGDPIGGYAETSRMKEILNWFPRVEFQNGVISYLEWLKNNLDLLDHLN